jgi:hypothetical protein
VTDRKPYHRRTLDETCEKCGSAPATWCTDLRTQGPAGRMTKRLHLYRPTHDESS